MRLHRFSELLIPPLLLLAGACQVAVDECSAVDPYCSALGTLVATAPVADTTEVITNNSGSTPASPTTTPATPGIYLFEGSNAQNGAMGGRAGADAICAAAAASQPAPIDTCANIRAFVSISGADAMVDFPANYGFSATNPVTGPTGISIGLTWNDVMDPGTTPLVNSLFVAGAVTTANHWTNADGLGGATANTCTGMTTNSGAVQGTTGQSGATNGNSQLFLFPNCNTLQSLICACDIP